MAFADITAYKAAVQAPQNVCHVNAASTSLWPNNNPLASLWTTPKAPNAASTPSGTSAVDRTTTGALGQPNASTGTMYAVAVESSAFRGATSSSAYAEVTGNAILADRLVQHVGLAANITTAQTTNLPTAALTRYTSGVGVWACIELYVGTGNGTSTATVSYTNSAGVAGQTGYALLGNSPINAASLARQMAMVTLAAGDVGIRSVESVTLSAALPSAGTLGITLFKPLLFVPLGVNDSARQDVLRGTLGGGLPAIQSNACLWWFLSGNLVSTNNGSVSLSLSLAEA